MLIVGLTGGIGCGKSTACNFFAQLGIPVIDTDELAREAVGIESSALAKLTEEFGTDILLPDKSLNRSLLRKQVFADPESLTKLESILHPEIRRLLSQRLTRIDAEYVIVAIPLLLEKNWRDTVDRILVIDCPVELQIKRALKRDHDTEEGIRRIMEIQVSRDDRLAAADDVIHNDSDLASLRQQVYSLNIYYNQLVSR